MTVKLLTEQHMASKLNMSLDRLILSQHLSKCSVVGNHMLRLICWVLSLENLVLRVCDQVWLNQACMNIIDFQKEKNQGANMGLNARKPVFGVSEKRDSNQSPQLQRLARK